MYDGRAPLRPQLTALARTTTPAPGMQIPVPDRSSGPFKAQLGRQAPPTRTNRSPMPIIDAANPRDRYRHRSRTKARAAQTWSRSPTQENIHAAPAWTPQPHHQLISSRQPGTAPTGRVLCPAGHGHRVHLYPIRTGRVAAQMGQATVSVQRIGPSVKHNGHP